MDVKPEISTLNDFQNCCRLCFEPGSQLENLFASCNKPNFVEKIGDCLDISISQEDFPATLICVQCLTMVDQFYDFKQLCKLHDHTFRTSIRTKTSDELFHYQPTEVFIKSEVLDDAEEAIQLAPLDIPSESIKQEMTLPDESAATDKESLDAMDPVDGRRARRGKSIQPPQSIAVRLIYNGYIMRCNGIKQNGVMNWGCRNSACRVSFSTTSDWQILQHLNNVHNHLPYVERKGMIRCVNTGIEERYAVSTSSGKTVLIWDGHEWIVNDKNNARKRRANCKDQRNKCRKYLMITDDFSALEHFGEHNHKKNFIVYRDEENPDDSDLNPWDLFCQVNPCKLPIGNDWESNKRVKLFFNRFQYRLLDCSWGGVSRWVCDTVNCPIMATMNDLGTVNAAEHNHEPLASGLFNGIYYCVVRANARCLKLFFNGYCYGSRDSDHWVCTLTACYAKIFVGSNFETFAEKGVHTHPAYSAIVKPLHKDAIHLTPQSPFIPPSIVISDLHERTSSSSTTKPTQSEDTSEKFPKKKSTQDDEQESSSRSVRMFFDGFRYTLWEIFPDGTTYWRCWGMRCNKSLHMSPTGSIYFKNESLEHQHAPHVASVNHIIHEDGQMDRYAIYKDTTLNTILAYRNVLWHLVLGEASYIGACREPRCEAKLKITDNFSRFEHIGVCDNHGDKLLLIRTAKELVPGDPNIWELFKQRHPLRLVDGTIHNGGRHSQLFIGGYRYTMQGINWNGSCLWRCALQKCPTKCRIIEYTGTFSTPSHNHNHEKQELLQGKIWSQSRQQIERYFVIITLKKTTATLYYNTYCYSLKDKERNVWSCVHSQCNASLRIQGDFEWVVEEMVHTHTGTLTFVRDDETAESQECYGPVPGTSRKRSRKDAGYPPLTDGKPMKLPCLSGASSSTSNTSPKLETIINSLVDLVPKIDQNAQQQSTYYYHGGYTYSRSTTQTDGNTKLECNRLRCPGRITLAPDQTVLSQESHTHSKTFDNVGSIMDSHGQSFTYILVCGTQKRTVTYFVCDGFRYHVQNKVDEETGVIWQCVKCDVKVTVNDSYSQISFSAPHNHESCDKIIPGDDNADSSNLDADDTFQVDEIILGQHRYSNPIYIRRMKQTKWKCFRLKDCRAYVVRNQDGGFKQMDQHVHEGPVELCGEASFDQTMKIKDRFSIMKQYGKSKFRHLVFQNQVYVESKSHCWNCVRYSCTAKLSVDTSCYLFQLIGEHSHQPIRMDIKFPNEVQPVIN